MSVGQAQTSFSENTEPVSSLISPAPLGGVSEPGQRKSLASGRTAVNMAIANKTTIEIDEDKLNRVMKLGGFKTRKEAVDWALTEAERLAAINRIAETPWTSEIVYSRVDPAYDIMAVRRQPVRYDTKASEKIGMTLLVDSAIYIGFLRAGIDFRQRLLPALRAGDLYGCGIVRAEVLRGVKNPRLKADLESFFDILPEVPTDAKMWRQISDLGWELGRKGKWPPVTDLAIAACALRIGANSGIAGCAFPSIFQASAPRRVARLKSISSTIVKCDLQPPVCRI